MRTRIALLAGLAVAATAPAAALAGGESMREDPAAGKGRTGGEYAGKVADAKRQELRSVEGTIERAKEVGLKGTDVKHQVVLLRSGDRTVVVDLGRVSALREQGVRTEKGERLQAQGRIRRVGDRAVLFAERIQQGQRAATVERPSVQLGRDRADTLSLGESRRMSGRVARKKDVATTNGGTNTVVLLERSNGMLVPVDLGPKTALVIPVEVGTVIAVEGTPTRAGDRIIFEAESVRSNDRVAEIERPSRG